MEKRFTLALVLSLLVLIVWQVFIMPRPEKVPPQDQPEKVEGPPPGESERPPPGPGAVEEFPPVVVDPALVERTTLANEQLRLVFSNQGGVLETAELLDFSPTAQARHDGSQPLRLLAPSPQGLHSLRLEDLGHPSGRLGEVLWQHHLEDEGRTLVFEHEYTRAIKPGEEGGLICRVRKEFTLPSGRARHLRVRITYGIKGEKSGLVMPCEFALLVSGGVFQEAGGGVMTPPRSALFPVEDELKLVDLREATKAEEKQGQGVLATLRGGDGGGVRKALGEAPRYAADLSSYLGVFMLLRQFPPRVSAVVHSLGDQETGRLPNRGDLGSDMPRTCSVLTFREDLEQGAEIQREALIYLGPLDSGVITSDLGMESSAEAEALSEVYEDQLGWASFIGKIVLAVLRTLHSMVGSWGWAIVFLTVLVRIVLFPVNRRSQGAMMRHQEAMARIKPKLEALKKKYEKDPKRFAQEQMQLMKSEGVPIVPLGGCLPIFLQIPIFFGLFAALRASIGLRQAPWLWVSDLSEPDHLIRFAEPVFNPMSVCGSCCGVPQAPLTGLHLLPLLMTAAWVLNSYFMPRPASNDPQMEQQRKMMLFMPVLFGLMMYSYAAGLSLYWLTSSLLGIVETRLIKKFWPMKAKTAS